MLADSARTGTAGYESRTGLPAGLGAGCSLAVAADERDGGLGTPDPAAAKPAFGAIAGQTSSSLRPAVEGSTHRSNAALQYLRYYGRQLRHAGGHAQAGARTARRAFRAHDAADYACRGLWRCQN